MTQPGSDKNLPTGKTVLLFSGGMDSLMAAKLLEPDVLLHIRHGNRYEAAELASVMRLVEAGHVSADRLVFDRLYGLGEHERADAIIPLRNLHFLALAAGYGETLYIGAMQGDRSLDKSPAFLRAMEQMLDLLYREQHWCEQRTFSVLAPHHGLTKTMLVGRYLQAGHPARALLDSLSCYDPVEPLLYGQPARPCGRCKPCFRKWVSLENNLVATAGYFAADPWRAPWLPAVWPQVLARTYRGDEDLEWMAALETVGYAPVAG